MSDKVMAAIRKANFLVEITRQNSNDAYSNIDDIINVIDKETEKELIISFLDFDSLPPNLLDAQGLILYAEKDYIAINTRYNKGIQKFALAHELGHFLFDESSKKNKFSISFSKDINFENESNENEIVANAFAVNLLVPSYSFNKLNKLNNSVLAEIYNVDERIIAAKRKFL